MSIVLNEYSNGSSSAMIEQHKDSILYYLVMIDRYGEVVCYHSYKTFSGAYRYMQKYYNGTMKEI